MKRWMQSLFISISIKDYIRIVKRKLEEPIEYLELLHLDNVQSMMFLQIDGIGSPVSMIIADI